MKAQNTEIPQRDGLRAARILLVVGGGVSAYKSLELTRRLKERGAEVRVILTAAATRFATPLSFAAVGAAPAQEDLFDAPADGGSAQNVMSHIDLARFGDMVIVAPATADLLARMATGLASDLATATLLASDKPLLLAPAMNPHMWNHPATRRNLARLQSDGALPVGPNQGDTACGEAGIGRMAEVEEILQAAADLLSGDMLLAGLRALVTSGPTVEAIDALRFISNRASGRQGHAIAAELARAGAHVTLVHGPCARNVPPSVRGIAVQSAQDMLDACEAALPVDVAVMAAAVGDWRASNGGTSGKMRKDGTGAMTLDLVETPDILKTLSRRKRKRPSLVLGFAVEEGTQREILARARAKRKRKGCDWIAANAIEAMGNEESRLWLLTSANDKGEEFSGAKTAIARALVRRIAEHMIARAKR